LESVTMLDEMIAKPVGAPDNMYGPDGRPRFFSDPAMDRFVAVVLNMASEMWVQEERLRALEGGPAASEAEREAGVQAFVDRLFEPLREQRR
jgi:hypothetical protein